MTRLVYNSLKVYVEDATGQFRSVLEGLGPEGTRKDQPITYVPDGAVPQTTGKEIELLLHTFYT